VDRQDRESASVSILVLKWPTTHLTTASPRPHPAPFLTPFNNFESTPNRHLLTISFNLRPIASIVAPSLG
jgi:hypothetical protein